jgi:DNA repair exonuclease SbcCD nuclease subunit
MKVLLIADTHLRTSQYARTSRGDDFAQALLNVFNLAVRERITTICISGDLLDSTRPSPKIIQFLKALDEQACQKGILILVISGNHDLTEPHWATVAGVTTTPGSCGLRIIDNQLVTLPCGLTVYGQPFVNKERFLNLVSELPQADILLFHAMVQELTHFKDKAALELTDLPTDKYQVIALGDVHARKYVKVGNCLVGQPGSTELCASNEDENKTATVVTFDDNLRLVGEPEFLPFATRQVLRFKLTTEEQLEQALLTAETQRHHNPIVIVEHDVALLNVQQRFASRLDPTKVILRFFPLFKQLSAAGLGDDMRQNLPLSAFLEKLIPPGTPLYTLAASLLTPEANTVELVDRYIESRRQELVSTT